MKKFITFLMIFTLLGFFAKAQVLMTTTGSYFENFDGLPNTGTPTWTDNTTLANWWANRTGTGTTIIAGNGSSNTGGLYSYGATSATDRALGSLGSGGAAAGNFAYGVQLQNNSGVYMTDISVAFVGEQWRDGGANGGTPAPQTAAFYYKVSPTALTSTSPNANTGWTAVPALNFTSPIYVNATTGAALDGNVAPNRTIVNAVTIPSLVVPAGYYIMLKWDDPNQTGNDHGLSVDSVTVAWTVPANTITPGTITGSPFTVTPTTGTAVDVPFTATGTFNAGNVFTAYLSDATGSFASETAIGTLSATASGTINATIPANTPAGTAYRIRVKSSDPAVTGIDNGADLAVNLFIPDLTPPVATNAWATSLSNITVVFDEKLQQTSAETAANYTFSGTAVTGTATARITLDTVDLVLSTPLSDGVTDTLRVTGVADSAGNPITLVYKFPVSYTLVTPPVATNAYATSLSNIVVAFNEKLQPSSAETAANYTFFGTAVTGTATLRATKDTVDLVLSTPLNVAVTDTLYINNVADSVGNIMTQTYKFPVSFGNLIPPVVLNAYATSLTNVVVAFDEELQAASAQNALNYTFVGTAVTGTATLRASKDTVDLVLSTPLTTDVTDSVKITGVTDTLGNVMSLTYTFPVMFSTTPPVALTAYATSLTNVVVVFNEQVQTASAETAANYTFTGTAVTGTATLRPSLDSVNLVLSTPLTSGVTDTLRVNNVADLDGNAMTLTYKFPLVFTAPAAIDTLVYWNFPNFVDDSIADGGITANLSKTIVREGAFFTTDTLSFGAGATTSALRSLKWNGGTGTKYWVAEFTTLQYDSIRFSSKQRSSNTAPRKFIVEYSLDGTVWTAVPGGTVNVGNNFTLGVLNNLSLPADCYNAPNVKLRWIMANDTAVNGSLVAATGASNIDDIYVFGRFNPLLGVNCQDNKPVNFSVYPNPATGSFSLQLEKNAEVRIDIMNITGQVVLSEVRDGNRFSFDISDLSKGMYIIRLVNLADQTTSIKKLSVQ